MKSSFAAKSFLWLIVIVLFATCQEKIEIDLLLSNGKIYTLEKDSLVEAVAIDAGKIIACGTKASLKKKYTPKKEIDLSGKAAYPGFIDGHCHFLGYARTLQNVDLLNVRSEKEMLQRVQNFAKAQPEVWIQGRGWDQTRWQSQAYPNKKLFDKYFPNTPLLLRRVDGHAALANSAALNLAGFHEQTYIVGGEILKNEDGSLSGILLDNAVDSVLKVFPEADYKRDSAVVIQAQENCFQVGLTTLVDAGLPLKDVLFLQRMDEDGSLIMPIDLMISAEKDNINHFSKSGKYFGNNLQIKSIKCYLDGALGSRGALLLEPYSDDTTTNGLQIVTDSAMLFYAQAAKKMDFQFNTHAIGDGAVRKVLNTYAQVLNPVNDARWRVEHSQVVQNSDLEMFKKWQIIPSVQSTHATSDMRWAEQRLGAERVKLAYTYSDLLECNGWIINGSDFPVEHINPLYGYYAAVCRKDHNNEPSEGFQMEQALSRMQALKAMTIWAAKGSFMENELGSLAPGKWANIVVLEDDLLTAEAPTLWQIPVKYTIIKGAIRYELGE